VAKQPQALHFFNAAGFSRSERFAYNEYAALGIALRLRRERFSAQMIPHADLSQMAMCLCSVVLLASAGLTERDLQIHFTLLTYSALVAITLVVIARTAWRLRDTTLRAPLVWTAVALVAVAAAAIIGARNFSAAITDAGKWNFDIDKWMLVAALSTFCPTVAILGAKRPQNRPWQWIVVSLWAIVAWPAAASLVTGPREALEMHAVWKWFYAALIIVGWVNYLPTRRGVAMSLTSFGQIAMLRYWPLRYLEDHNASILNLVLFGYGAMFVAVGTLTALIKSQQRPRAEDAGSAEGLVPWNRVWQDFRDSYGAVWALRVMERINALATSTGAELALGWRGFQLVTGDAPDGPDSGGALAAREVAKIEVGLRSLLCRFVSNDWIDARLQSGSSDTPPGRAVLTRPAAP
jgi:hypothetical protein